MAASFNALLVAGSVGFFGINFVRQPIDIYSLGFVPIFFVTYLMARDTARLFYYLSTGNVIKHER